MAMKRANGTGTVYKMKGKLRKPYRAMVTIGKDLDGKTVRQTIGMFATQREAQEALLKWQDNPTIGVTKKVTLGEAWQWTIEDRIRKNVSSHRMAQFNTYRKVFEPLLNTPIEDIRLPHLQRIFDDLHHAPSSLSLIKKTLSSVFNVAIKHDVIVKNCVSAVTIPKVEKSTVHKPLTYETIAWLWNNYKTNRAAMYMLILVYTGMRPGELVNIKMEHVDIKHSYMIGGSKTESGSNRVIPIAKSILPILKEWYQLALFKKEDRLAFMYPTTYSVSNDFNREISTTFPVAHKGHDGRHTFATLMSSLKVQEHIIKRILGHALTNNITQDIYTHTDKIELIEAVNKLPTKTDIQAILHSHNQAIKKV